MALGKIVYVPDTPGTHWERPWSLREWNGFALVERGRYRTEDQARTAARRRGISVGPDHRPMKPPSKDWRID